VAAVSQHGSLRDRTLLIVALHTGLRAEELSGLKREHVHLGRRSGHVSIYGKRNKYREVPLNSTARDALISYFADATRELDLSVSIAQARRLRWCRRPGRRARADLHRQQVCRPCKSTGSVAARSTTSFRLSHGSDRAPASSGSAHGARLAGHDTPLCARHPAGSPAGRRNNRVGVTGCRRKKRRRSAMGAP